MMSSRSRRTFIEKKPGVVVKPVTRVLPIDASDAELDYGEGADDFERFFTELFASADMRTMASSPGSTAPFYESVRTTLLTLLDRFGNFSNGALDSVENSLVATTQVIDDEVINRHRRNEPFPNKRNETSHEAE
jgi:hypothetical protein